MNQNAIYQRGYNDGFSGNSVPLSENCLSSWVTRTYEDGRFTGKDLRTQQERDFHTFVEYRDVLGPSIEKQVEIAHKQPEREVFLEMMNRPVATNVCISRLVRIPSADDAAYDVFVMAPENLARTDAISIVNREIDALDQGGGGGGLDILLLRLNKHGFVLCGDPMVANKLAGKQGNQRRGEL